MQKVGLTGLVGKWAVAGQLTVLSFLSELGPLIRVGPGWARIEPDRVGVRSSLKSGLRGGLTRLIFIGNL